MNRYYVFAAIFFLVAGAAVGQQANEANSKAKPAAARARDLREIERLEFEWNRINEATISAVNAHHVPWFSQSRLLIYLDGFLDDQVITGLGWERINGRNTRMYKISGVNNKIAPTVRGAVRKNRHENDYWFDEKTGAIVKARTREDEFRDESLTTDIVTHEWELDPRIEIKTTLRGRS